MEYRYTSKHLQVLAARDVERVRQHAHTVLEITPQGVVEKTNAHFGIGVIAIIGPGEVAGIKLPHVVLCEIGLGQSRPYHACRVPRAERQRLGFSYVSRRRKWGTLTEDQYRLVAGSVFQILQQSVDGRVTRWRSGGRDNPWYLKGANHHYYTVGRGWNTTSSSIICIRGGRFSVSLEDRFFVRDIYWSEIHSPVLAIRLRGLARFIDKCFKRYRGKGRKKGYRRSFQKLEYVQRVREMLLGQRDGWLPPYLMMHVLNHLPEGKKNRLYPEVAELVTHVAKAEKGPLPEEVAAQAALARPVERLGKIELRVVPRRGKRDHIVFEVFPTQQKSWEVF